MNRLVVFYFLIAGALSYTITIGCSTSSTNTQLQGDTVVTVFGRRVLIPMGPEEPYLNMGTNARGKHLRPRPFHRNAIGEDRQVVFSQIRLWGVVGGEETTDAYYRDWANLAGDKQYSLIEVGKTDYGRYAIICQWCTEKDAVPLYRLYWFTPNEDYAFQILYVLEPGAYEKLGGMAELKRFANRVRLLPD